MNSIAKVNDSLSYFHLLAASEQGRWNFTDLDWAGLDRGKVDEDLIENVKTLAFGELTTFSATESFMKLFHDDVDFTQWLAVWFYEETKHPMAFIRWLSVLGISVDEEFIFQGRQITPMTSSKTEMLTFNIISEISAGNMYLYLRDLTGEPLLKEITRNLARDEMRHSVGFTEYCRKVIQNSDDPDREKLRVLRTTWYMLQQATQEDLTRHPVLLTRNRARGIDWKTVTAKVNDQVVTRISNLVDMSIPDASALYEVYSAFKQDYRVRRNPASASA